MGGEHAVSTPHAEKQVEDGKEGATTHYDC